ncbi:MAG: aminoglycoside phosphotransferase family protein [Actinomycetota bacterium]
MHTDEVGTDEALVRALIREQFPDLADRAIRPVPSAGTDNALYRLGEDLVARLPRVGWAVDSVDLEATWLPRLAPGLPLPVPAPIGRGEPGHGYPWPWTVCRWVPGTNPPTGATPRPAELATDLASFLVALRSADVTGAPPSRRGIPVDTRDDEVQRAFDELATVAATAADTPDGDPAHAVAALDLATLAEVWNRDRRASRWDGPPQWLHADLSPLNVVCDADGRLAGLLDFGVAGIGDPAADLYAAWTLLPTADRPAFRAGLDIDDAQWARGRAWALSIALLQLP